MKINKPKIFKLKPIVKYFQYGRYVDDIDPDEFWCKYEYDNYGNIIYREDSDGEIIEWSQTKK